MLNPSTKIRYRLVFNRARRLNARGEGLIQIECQQGDKRIYFSTGIYVEPRYWQKGQVVDHELANDYNLILRRQRIDIERIELDYLKRDVKVNLNMIREAVQEKTTPTAQLVDFGRKIIASSDRRDVTKANYRTLFNNIETFRRGVRVDEVDYAFVCKYDQWLKDSNIQHNTRIGRLRLLRSILNEAVKRDMIARNPFDKYHVQGMVSRHGFLTEEQLYQIEQLSLNGKTTQVRDCFLFCCYTGLRYSDLRELRSEHLKDGWLRLTTHKTGCNVAIPYTKLFDGKAAEIITHYGRPENMTRNMPTNSQVNSILKDILRMAKIQTKERVTFHTSRHTFASLLLQDGMPVTTVQKLLGHTKVQTTQIYAEVTEETISKDINRYNNKKQQL